MSKKLNKIMSLILVIAMCALLVVGCGGQKTPASSSGDAKKEDKKESLKAALLLSGPINDGGWNTDAYNGLMELKKMGFQTAYTENVKASDIETTIRNYAKNGFNFIIGHGYEYGDALTKVAPDFPDVKFFQNGGPSKNGKNLGSAQFRYGEMSYIAGGIAAKTTKTNKVGFVGAQEIPSIATEVQVIKDRVVEVNPKATVTVAYTGSWTDINKGKEAALAQINNGVDVIIGIGDAVDAGAIQACQEKGIKFIGWSGDLNSLAPDIVLTSAVQSVSTIIKINGQELLDGKFFTDTRVMGIKEGVQLLGTFSPTIDPEVKAQAIKEFEGIKSGTFKVKEFN